MSRNQDKLSIIPLGGVGEIGKNMFVFQYKDEIVVVDAGLKFPDEEMLGIDIVIPDYTYLIENKDKIKGLVITHGHEDHIGGVPYLLKNFSSLPIYGTKLTLGLVGNKLKEHQLSETAQLNVVNSTAKIELGKHFEIEFFHVNHSIPDATGLIIKTPEGIIVHSGDFKFDQTPVDGKVTNYQKLAELGNQNVIALLVDSTNAERPGITLSERSVGIAIDEAFRSAQQRIIVATFASNVHRLQQVIESAVKFERKVTVVGRSMINVVQIAMELGYLHVPDGVLVDIDEIDKLPGDEIVILSTGSQGEPMSALSRMARGAHRKVEVLPGDTVILAATPIPGNEKLVSKTIDLLFKCGASVTYRSVSGVHVSGHGSQEELKLMMNLVKPKHVIPIHGEYRMMRELSNIAEQVGITEEHVIKMEIGDVVEFSQGTGRITGKVPSGNVLIDGLGIGDVGNIVLRDRKLLSQDGILVVVVTLSKKDGSVLSGPDIVSRGFVYVRESEKLLEEANKVVADTLSKMNADKMSDWSSVKTNVKESLGKFLFERTRRKPMILPIIMEV
ncbi:ribonuclease J [Desulfuribacillus alkaliarsenatis]|uniref:Ribonuclease J n=1 Tax=Desulfuribacillus alkaliarsenatis TaxID=766136 RepID=A0A1E5G680_9FIRM|nr:ribonuclease J [Desulfuribacillus alkaliarsenatis]OEF98663.1 ribonuclease J [Desulfuribacillus alkaliarsenatis]